MKDDGEERGSGAHQNRYCADIPVQITPAAPNNSTNGRHHYHQQQQQVFIIDADEEIIRMRIELLKIREEKKRRRKLQLWSFLLLFVVVSLVLINDMMIYGEFEIVKKVEGRMKVEVYYETLCPDSKHFIIKQLKPAYEKLHSIMDISFIPYGKAKREELAWGTKHSCQHGEVECLGNTVHACVVDVIPDQRKQLEVISCMIDRNEQPIEIGQKCVEKYSGEGGGKWWEAVSECVKSPKAAVLQQTMGVRTENLNPKVSFIPTIRIDGDLSEQNHILQNLHKIICQRYRGEKPSSC